MDEASQTTQRIICLKLETLESTRHKRMHAKDAKNDLRKARYRRELSKEISKDLESINRKL